MSPLPLPSIGFDPFLEGFSLPVSWLSDHWLWFLCLGSVGLAVILIRSWSWLLDWDEGRWWPVPASILPAMIPIARTLEENASAWVKTGTVVVLLTAVAIFQVYGQVRHKRDRLKQELARARAESRISEQRNLLIAAINEAREERDEARERARSTEALLCRIADGITTAAATAEEAREENQ
jgi:hypothetical protein